MPTPTQPTQPTEAQLDEAFFAAIQPDASLTSIDAFIHLRDEVQPAPTLDQDIQYALQETI